MSTAIAPLAHPKGVKHACELCGEPAKLECGECKVTFWCSSEHESLDRQGIHWRICEFLGPLRRPFSGLLGSQMEREQRHEQQQHRREHLMRLSLVEAQKLFNQGKYVVAVPAAMQALKFGQDCFGLNNVELAQPYILMGIACIGVGDLKQAEGYLSQANWIIVKNPDCSAALRAHLFRALGRLYRATGAAAMALRLLADDVYHCSLAAGPEGVRAAGGYYLMAAIFESNHVLDAAKAAYGRVAHIWLQQLRAQRQGGGVEPLDGAQEAEAEQHLAAIAGSALCGGEAAGRASLALGLLKSMAGDEEGARVWFAAARQSGLKDVLQELEVVSASA